MALRNPGIARVVPGFFIGRVSIMIIGTRTIALLLGLAVLAACGDSAETKAQKMQKTIDYIDQTLAKRKASGGPPAPGAPSVEELENWKMELQQDLAELKANGE